MHLIVTDANTVRDFVPVVVRVKTEAALGLLGVVQFSVAACESKTGTVVDEAALPYYIYYANSLWISCRSLRIFSRWGHSASHLPQSRQAEPLASKSV